MSVCYVGNPGPSTKLFFFLVTKKYYVREGVDLDIAKMRLVNNFTTIISFVSILVFQRQEHGSVTFNL